MSVAVWEHCLAQLQSELPEQQFNTWIRPLRVEGSPGELRLFAPNRFVLDWVNNKFLHRIKEIVSLKANLSVEIQVAPKQAASFSRASVSNNLSRNNVSEQTLTDSTSDSRNESGFEINSKNSFQSERQFDSNNLFGSQGNQNHKISMDFNVSDNFLKNEFQEDTKETESNLNASLLIDSDTSVKTRIDNTSTTKPARRIEKEDIEGGLTHRNNLNSSFTFASFVEGKSNQLGLAASTQVAENPGGSYNPLFIYGGVGLGKTHLMHAVGNALMAKRPNAKVIYLHSERFVADMVKALQLNAINDFKRYYRSVDALLIDDIQFFAGKERSQEEFFHTFNALLEGGQQIILTCDRYPKEITGVEERLKSRFGWGLTVAIEPPELETRVAILMKKAYQAEMELPHDAAFFIAQRIRSNVRELEGALKRVIANAHFTGKPISIDLVREALKDLLALQDRLVSIENIQRVVAEYYKIKVSDLLSKRRSRSVARPRQVAMQLAKELTNHSLPEIGDSFGGRDHTTVLHACRKIKELLDTDGDIREDVKNLMRTLTT